LGSAVVQDDFRERFAIEGKSDPLIREEGANPITQGVGEAKEGENVDQAADMEVVEESLDIKQEETSNVARFDTSLDGVCCG